MYKKIGHKVNFHTKSLYIEFKVTITPEIIDERQRIYTIKTRLKYICVRIYMFICSELIEETARPPGLIFGMWRYLWHGSDNFEFWKKIHTFDGVMT